jgi:hypothetical protein
MDKAIIDEYKGQEIDFSTGTAKVDGIEYNIDKKSFRDGKVLLQLKKSDLIVPLSIPISEMSSVKYQIIIAFSTTDKRNSLINRFKNIIRILKYYLKQFIK